MTDEPSIAVLGSGHVGLVTAVCLAHLGHPVRCGDADQAKVEQLRGGQPTIYEEGLEPLLVSALRSGLVSFTTDLPTAVAGTQFVFLCLPTPTQPDGSTDLTSLEDVCGLIGPHLSPQAIVVNKSTVPIGASAMVIRLLGRPDVAVVSSPEFLREGTAVHDTLHPTRIVVGASTEEDAQRVLGLYRSIDAPALVTAPRTAEMIKYVSNVFLATKLSFVNDVAMLCEVFGADVDDLLRGVGLDPRIGSGYLRPGPGWGGSCLPKDAHALAAMARGAGVDFALLEAAIQSNQRHIDTIVAKTRGAIGDSFEGTTVGAWGLTFKAGTNDLRFSAALEVLRRIVAEGATIAAFDPTTVVSPVPDVPTIGLAREPYAAVVGAHALVILTEWEEFASPDFGLLSRLMAKRTIVDARNLLDPSAVRAAGFSYVGVGRL